MKNKENNEQKHLKYYDGTGAIQNPQGNSISDKSVT